MWILYTKGEKLSNFKGSRSWRLILLFSVFALVVVACGGDTAEEEVAVEETETTEAPATTAAAAEEAAPSGPDGVYKMAIFSDPNTKLLELSRHRKRCVDRLCYVRTSFFSIYYLLS